MHTPTTRARAVALALALAPAGCAEPPDEAVTSDDLINGVATDARPEIGSFSGRCTATLISPRWAITAGHCTFYMATPQPGDVFTITRGLDGLAHDYSIDRVHIFGAFAAAGDPAAIAFEYTPDATGTNDVAILHLTTAVPPSVAVPAVLASGPPASGTTVTVFGYGCQVRNIPLAVPFKQALTYSYPSSNLLCKGDSGGPVVIGQATGSGAVFQVNTGIQWNPFNTWDVHGEAT